MDQPNRSRRRSLKPGKSRAALSITHPNAAGIDIGSAAHFEAVPPDRDDEPVPEFPSFTADLERMADWLNACGVDTVAMESTGVYWIPVFVTGNQPASLRQVVRWYRSERRGLVANSGFQHIQVLSLLVAADASFFAVPLAGRIHEGVKFTNRDQRTLPTKFAALLDSLAIAEPIYLVAGAYYACQQIALPLQRSGSHLISRVRRSTAAYQPVPLERGSRRRGRPRLYGEKLKLWDLFGCPDQAWQSAPSPVYGERGVTLRLLCLDLLWRPLRQLVRFVLVDHPTRGRMILISTDLAMPAIDVIRLYGLRFNIELSFKQALRVVGVYAYHFWMRAMPKIAHGSGTQHLHRKNASYRDAEPSSTTR